MRSALAVSSRGDISQLAVAAGGRVRVLFSPGGNQAVPGAPGTFYSALWFSSDAQAMEMKVVGTTITYVPNPAFSTIQKDRNPAMTVFDGRDAPVTMLRFINYDNNRFVEFGYNAAIGKPHMGLYNVAQGQWCRYEMNAGGTGFTITPFSLPLQADVINLFPNSANREGITIIRTGPGDQGVTDVDAVGVKNYSTEEPFMGAFMRAAVGGIRLRNNLGQVVEITPGVAGALGAVVV